MHGYKPGRFSFNVKGGRCEACQGDGVRQIEMHFLPDVYVHCEECQGQRFNEATLRGPLQGQVDRRRARPHGARGARALRRAPARCAEPLALLADVGLDYLHLGQPSPTLSGGEAQRIKLARELARRATGRTLYILDEPTTGLHFDDVRKLLDVLARLVDAGNTVVVIEHNLDVIKSADWVIDLGPEGGPAGGRLVAAGNARAGGPRARVAHRAAPRPAASREAGRRPPAHFVALDALRRPHLPTAVRSAQLHPAGHHRLLAQPLHVLRHVSRQDASACAISPRRSRTCARPRRVAGDRIETLFVADGDALVLPMDHWLPILAAARSLLPAAAPRLLLRDGAQRAGEDATPNSRGLRAEGLSLLYLGPESGDDVTLKRIAKGGDLRRSRRSGAARPRRGSADQRDRAARRRRDRAQRRARREDRRTRDRDGPRLLRRAHADRDAEHADRAPRRDGTLPAARRRRLAAANCARSSTARAPRAPSSAPTTPRTTCRSRGRLPHDRERIVAAIDAALDGRIPLRPEWARGL